VNLSSVYCIAFHFIAYSGKDGKKGSCMILPPLRGQNLDFRREIRVGKYCHTRRKTCPVRSGTSFRWLIDGIVGEKSPFK